MIRVTAPSRLHFGLFALPTAGVTHWPQSEGESTLPIRHFGGVGLMIDQPGVQVGIEPASTWSATGPSAERALAFGRQFVTSLPEEQQDLAFTVSVDRCSPEHVGLGAGTQLALAVARALAMATGHGDWDAQELARRVGRGLRSSLGIHGFERGGLLVEGGKSENTAIAPLLVRESLPDEWQVLLIVPQDLRGAHGQAERAAFAQLAHQEANLRRTETLCRLVLLGLLPAVAERDLPTFGEALYEFNHEVGLMFAPWQGGPYAHPQTAELISWLRRQGIKGVGQSSWGPAVFAIDRLDALERVREHLLDRMPSPLALLTICRANYQGADVQ